MSRQNIACLLANAQIRLSEAGIIRRLTTLGWIACGLAVLCVRVCDAGTLPAATYHITSVGTSSVPITLEFDQQSEGGQYSLRASAAGGDKPQADLQIHASSVNSGAGYEVRVTYFFCVNELEPPPVPVPSVPVQISIAGSASVSGSGRLTALAGVNILGFGISERIAEARLGVSGRPDVPQAEFSQIISGSLPVGEVFGIVLRSHGSAMVGRDETGEIQAVADPAVIIDPSFQFRDFYEVRFSSNLGIPEPSTFALVALGLAGLALANLRPEKRNGQVPATHQPVRRINNRPIVARAVI